MSLALALSSSLVSLALGAAAVAGDSACNPTGDCFAAHDAPGCSNLSCCLSTCAVDPYCCSVEWDVTCVSHAFNNPSCYSVPPCAGVKAFTCQGGCEDDFAGGPDGPAGNPFDVVNVNQLFSYSFSGCWPNCGPGSCGPFTCGTVTGAKIEMRVRAELGGSSNDKIYLTNGSTILWAESIATLMGGPWNAGNVATITLDLQYLPNSLPGVVLASLCDGELGLLVQDDTTVDFANLTVQWCPCQFPFMSIVDRDEPGFDTPSPTTPQPALVAADPACEAFVPYDQSYGGEACFIDTIDGIPTCLRGCTLKMGVWWFSNATIYLDLDGTCTTFRWSYDLQQLENMGYVNPPHGFLQPGILTLDLDNLPPDANGTRSILSGLLDGRLDIKVKASKPGVDFVHLEFDACGCDTPNTSGACCFLNENDAFQCVITDQLSCEKVLGGTWGGPGTTCADVDCPPGCAEPPAQMVLWMPFVSITGTITEDNAWKNYGTLMNSPFFVPGVVGTGLSFDGIDDYVSVPNSSSLNMGTSDFSIDLWMRMPPLFNVRSIVDKRDLSSSALGYTFFTWSGFLSLQLADAGSPPFTNYVSNLYVADGNWHHVAVTVDRDSPTGIVFYLDGVADIPQNPMARQGSLSNPAPLLIGKHASFTESSFQGQMDELEIFRKVLKPVEVADIYEAGAYGKCKLTCAATNDQLLDFSLPVSYVVSGLVCNNSSVDRTVTWSVNPSSGPGCNLTGTLAFTPSSGTITVPGNTCQPVIVGLIPPAGAFPGQKGCYTFTFIDEASGEGCQSDGSVIIGNMPIVISPLDPTAVAYGSAAIDVGFTIGWSGPKPLDAVAALKVFDHADGSEAATVSLNQLPPGTRYIEPFFVLPGTTKTVSATLVFLEPSPLRVYDVRLLLAQDGAFQPVGTVMVTNAPPNTPPCVADLDHNGHVDAADLAILLGAWGLAGSSADLTGDGLVSGADLAVLLGAWGPCP